MLSWIIENTATIAICLVLLGITAAIIAAMIKNRGKGKSSCGSCQGCPMSTSCQKH